MSMEVGRRDGDGLGDVVGGEDMFPCLICWYLVLLRSGDVRGRVGEGTAGLPLQLPSLPSPSLLLLWVRTFCWPI